jgi:hypothetical protein
MTNTDTDADPCRGCSRLIVDADPRILPRCERAAHPGQMGYTRHPPRRGAADAEHRGELPAETRRRAKGGRGRL